MKGIYLSLSIIGLMLFFSINGTAQKSGRTKMTRPTTNQRQQLFDRENIAGWKNAKSPRTNLSQSVNNSNIAVDPRDPSGNTNYRGRIISPSDSQSGLPTGTRTDSALIRPTATNATNDPAYIQGEGRFRSNQIISPREAAPGQSAGTRNLTRTTPVFEPNDEPLWTRGIRRK